MDEDEAFAAMIEATAQRCWGDDWRELDDPARAGIEAAIEEHVRALCEVICIDRFTLSSRYANRFTET